ncbi:hypothetical protein IW262DRAFT_512588 [Armillaria fumosa]|nr:hypothetical protein IW262DRAFT_512588 [Armillaria fumosa]
MTTRTYLGTAAPKLPDSQVKEIFDSRDARFNSTIFAVFLHGLYTGVVAVTLWAVVSRNNQQGYRRPHFLVLIILLLYILATFGIYYNWVVDILTFITNGKDFWLGYTSTPSRPILLTTNIVAILSSNLADATLIWRCWTIWSRSWRMVLVPIACSLLATASRGIITYYGAFGPYPPPQALYLENIVSWSVLYSSLILATLLWCTVLIIYRIWRVGTTAGRIYVYRRVIEILVESASLYSAVIVVLLVFEGCNEVAALYIQSLAAAMRGIMPTILVGRVAAGHARPDDSWNDSTPRSSLRFGNRSISHTDAEMSVGSGQDESLPVRPDLEEALEDSTRVRGEGSAPTVSAYECYAHIVRTSSSVDYSVI